MQQHVGRAEARYIVDSILLLLHVAENPKDGSLTLRRVDASNIAQRLTVVEDFGLAKEQREVIDSILSALKKGENPDNGVVTLPTDEASDIFKRLVDVAIWLRGSGKSAASRMQTYIELINKLR